MDCYSCGAALHAGQRSCRRCGLHFPLPVPGPNGQTVLFVAQYPPRPIISDRIFAQLAWRIAAWVGITVFIVLMLSSMSLATTSLHSADGRIAPAAGQAQSPEAPVAGQDRAANTPPPILPAPRP